MGAAEKPLQHLETHVIELELGRRVGSVDEKVEMIPVDQLGIAFVTPRFGVEMQAKHEVGTQLRINESGPLPDLAGRGKRGSRFASGRFVP